MVISHDIAVILTGQFLRLVFNYSRKNRSLPWSTDGCSLDHIHKGAVNVIFD